MLWQEKACRLLLGVLCLQVAFFIYCLCCANHLVIIVDGRKIPVIHFQGSVADALDKAQVTLRRADIVEPSLSSRVREDIHIFVTRVHTKEITNQEVIQYKILKKLDYNLHTGEQKVLQYGKIGLKRKYVQITYQNGKEVKRETLRTQVIRKPKPQVIAYGAAKAVSRGVSRPTKGGAIRNYSNLVQDGKTITVVSTAYTNTGRRTATGVYPSEGMVAVDPKVIPLGTKLYIEKYGFAVAADTGGDIKGNRVDVFFGSYNQAIKWGRRTVKVQILE
ncbi:3D domain protein [Desulforamulus reducens MI-1]|uniref:3D domain protein n=1 Tax=Desulforamulus reducens (strain ATCC BAA-1160 / DSM 100696 / MI-1) TaxID=349161 RepID=A4J0L6_DESRM|nr:3D domain-containing protein [Desulforamulus reducens]ABO48619.1 3D domain protein [Desulforamulus reducens MI-1]